MSSLYQFKLAKTNQELSDYFTLRRLIFVEEQGIFPTDDLDEIDATAYPIVAVNEENKVVGVVRIYESQPGIWYGGRLGTHPNYRRGWQIGKGLIYKAVSTANTWGCEKFLATVQIQNVRFFQRLHWQSLEEMNICGIDHYLMAADLNYYPPGIEPRPPKLLQTAS
jgi:putative N-acetyltransferase (TIGR04045 family)